MTAADGFGLHNLPWGVYSVGEGRRRIGVRFHDRVLDVSAIVDEPTLRSDSLNAFMATGRTNWRRVRSALRDRVSSGDRLPSTSVHDVDLHLPFVVGDYVDFYSSRAHAENLGRMFRPNDEPLTPNWLHLPIGYHGRSGTVVVSGTETERPSGQLKGPDDSVPRFGPSEKLDIEAEVGFVVGTPSELGRPIPLADFREHVFGVVLVNDWSARDLQAWEYVPLGPFLGKSFTTSISPWVVPLDALEMARIEPPTREVPLLPYLDDKNEPWGLDLNLEVSWNGTVVSRPPFASMYWTPAQQLAHMTVNGASVRTGDLFASGTVSGVDEHQVGSFIELSNNGKSPVSLDDGTTRTFLENGDRVDISGGATGPDGERISLGAVSGQISP